LLGDAGKSISGAVNPFEYWLLLQWSTKQNGGLKEKRDPIKAGRLVKFSITIWYPIRKKTPLFPAMVKLESCHEETPHQEQIHVPWSKENFIILTVSELLSVNP
jgi:hypothetical protein